MKKKISGNLMMSKSTATPSLACFGCLLLNSVHSHTETWNRIRVRIPKPDRSIKRKSHKNVCATSFEKNTRKPREKLQNSFKKKKQNLNLTQITWYNTKRRMYQMRHVTAAVDRMKLTNLSAFSSKNTQLNKKYLNFIRKTLSFKAFFIYSSRGKF